MTASGNRHEPPVPQDPQRRRRGRRLQDSLFRIQEAFLGTASYGQACDAVLDELLHATGSDHGFIGEVRVNSAGTPALEIHAISNLPGNAAAGNAVLPRDGARLASLVSPVLTSREMVLVNASADDGSVGESIIGVPLLAGGELLGVAGLARRRGRYDLEAQDRAEALATLTAQLVSGRRAERARREAEERLRCLVDLSVDWYWEQDSDFRYTWVSPSFYRHTGLPEGYVIGLRPWDTGTQVLSEEEKAEHLAQMQRHERYVDRELQLRLPNGNLMWISVSGEPVFEAEGIFKGYRGIGRMIDRRKRAELALRDSEAQYRLVVDNMAEGLAIHDTGGRIVSCNAMAQKILGLSEEQILGHLPVDPAWKLIRRNGTPLPPEEIPSEIVTRTGEKVLGRVIGVQRTDGATVWVQINAAPLPGPDGAIAGAVATFADVTERIEAVRALQDLASTLEQRVAERTRDLEESNRELESFSYSVSHDLRTPLRAINGFANLLTTREGDRLSDDGRQLLSRIERSALRMGELIDDVLEYSRITRKTVERAPVAMNALVAEVSAPLRVLNPRVALVVEPLGNVRADVAMLRSVLQNLIDNAFKYSESADEPRVTVSRAERGGRPAFIVADNGIGFDMTHAGKLFGMFQRLHHEHEFPGTGVGLAIVKRLVERHGGEVWTESEPGGGARFGFSLGDGL